MNEYRCYSYRLCKYLTDKGFRYTRVIQDIRKPEFLNWMFDWTSELQSELEIYFNK